LTAKVPDYFNFIFVFVLVSSCDNMAWWFCNLAQKRVFAAWLNKANMKLVLNLHGFWQAQLDIERV
jgi:hypothetical protein